MTPQIKFINYTKNPLTTIGECASECYNTTLRDDEHAKRIALHCIRSGHGRNMELADITISISGISSRMARELYTHIGGSPTRLQASTRYITYDDFEYITPYNLTIEQAEVYEDCMKYIQESYKKLKDLDCPNDITGYILPLAMDTTVVLKMNLRTLENMFNQRLCNRALLEFRDFMKILKVEISKLDDEWKLIADKLFVPKCIKQGYCCEDHCCGLMPKKIIKGDAK